MIVVGYPLVGVLGARPSVGDRPQNVNFAIRGEFVRNFLEANRIGFTASADSAAKHREVLDRADGAHVALEVRLQIGNPCGSWRKRATTFSSNLTWEVRKLKVLPSRRCRTGRTPR